MKQKCLYIVGGSKRWNRRIFSEHRYKLPSEWQFCANPSDWSFQNFSPVFLPNTFFDISETLETEIKAMQIYESEIRSFPHPRSPKALKAAARRWGSVAGMQAAEPFELIRDFR
jgi:LmbE family N-acetylglucosaminyl deacetylase